VWQTPVPDPYEDPTGPRHGVFLFNFSTISPFFQFAPSGIHDVQVVPDSPSGSLNYTNVTAYPIFLHIFRAGGDEVASVPVLLGGNEPWTFGVSAGGMENSGHIMPQGIAYLDRLNTVPGSGLQTVTLGKTYPPRITTLAGLLDFPETFPPSPTGSNPNRFSYYVEAMSPITQLLHFMQMWWGGVGATPDLPFIRGIYPENDAVQFAVVKSDGTGVWSTLEGKQLPIMDGGRGQGWASPYIVGQIDSTGVFYFVDQSQGAVRKMGLDGTMTTLLGWRTNSDQLPAWYKLNTSCQVRTRQNFGGQWTWPNAPTEDCSSTGPCVGATQGILPVGIRGPSDIAIDPSMDGQANPDLYVSSLPDHCIYKLTFTGGSYSASIYAGIYATPGWVDGPGATAQFFYPISMVWIPGATTAQDRLYIADHYNDAIRYIQRSDGVVHTLGANPNWRLIWQTPQGKPLFTYLTTPLSGGGGGLTAHQAFENFAPRGDPMLPTGAPPSPVPGELFTTGPGNFGVIYRPMCIRRTSTGKLVEMSSGYNAIRVIDPITGATDYVYESNTDNDASQYNETRWQWLDVDWRGQAQYFSTIDNIYFCSSNPSMRWYAGDPAQENHFNEFIVVTDIAGKRVEYLFQTGDLLPLGEGPAYATRAPHYTWMVTVGPKHVLIAGYGTNGIVRLRAPDANDLYVSTTNVQGSLFQNYSNSAPDRVGRLGKDINECGGDTGFGVGVGGVSPSLVHGYQGHNYLGTLDAWDTVAISALGGTEAVIDAFNAFNVDPSILTYQRYKMVDSGLGGPERCKFLFYVYVHTNTLIPCNTDCVGSYAFCP
jgi:hypothetical protein